MKFLRNCWWWLLRKWGWFKENVLGRCSCCGHKIGKRESMFDGKTYLYCSWCNGN